MQPLISPVDHESRHSSYRRDDEETPSENTPLLSGRFPEPVSEWSSFNTAVIVTLLFIMLTGIIIGIYLLIQQSNEENVLPPVELALRLVSNGQWDVSNKTRLLSLSPYRARHVVVVQTDSRQCWSTKDCIQLLQEMQNILVSGVLPYNFVISSNGETFEALGWRRMSPLFPEFSKTSLVLAFIGNFTQSPPIPLQLKEAQYLFDKSVSQRCLDPKYDVIGKNINYYPKYLFQSLQKLSQWSQSQSDT